MLDEHTNAPVQSEAKTTAPRRRRAASRPAGPPMEVPATPAQPETPATDATGPDATLAESEAKPKRTRRPRKPKAEPAAEAQAPEQTEVVEASQTPEPTDETKQADADAPAAADESPAAEEFPAAADEVPTAPDAAPEPEPQAGQEPAEKDAEAQAERPKRKRARARKPVADVDEALAAEEARLASLAAERTEAAAAEVPDETSRREFLSSLAEAIANPATVASEDSDESDETDEDGESEASSEDQSAEGDDDSEQSQTPRRRRRRGGRRRRRNSSSADSDSDSDSDASDDSDSADDEADDSGAEKSAASGEDADAAGEGDDTEERSSSTRRRRRRRRRGEDASGDDEPGTDVVVKVRDPRRSSGNGSDEVTGIEGSTRLAAKRQRRKESRAAGRRRAPILSEAEFLARRESVKRQMVIRQGDDYTQLAVLEDNVLVEHYVDRSSAASLIGNIYLGKIQNVLPSMEAAFIDIGRGRNAVLYAGEVDWEGLGVSGADRKFESVFKSGQSVLVQVSKDPVGAKGARLTSHISLPGRYIVYSPGGHLSGISRKLPETERERLRGVLGGLIGDEASVIVRTAAEGASEDELVRDVNRLKAQWEVIEKKSGRGGAPQLLYSEPDLTLRIVRDLFTEDFTELVVQGNGSSEDAFDAISAYVTHVAPHLAERMRRFEHTEGTPDVFSAYRIDEQINKALERKVFLPSGGSLIIDRTEAMTVVDVNTGKFTGTGGNLEATVTSNNLEAAEEIVRQLRLRDIGGIIVIDFIDMVLPANRELLLRRLVECLGRDRTRHQVAEVTSLGLVQLTRKKIGTGLAEAFTEQCDCCGGRGYSRSDVPVDSQAPADGGERSNRRRGRRSGGNSGNGNGGK